MYAGDGLAASGQKLAPSWVRTVVENGAVLDDSATRAYPIPEPDVAQLPAGLLFAHSHVRADTPGLPRTAPAPKLCAGTGLVARYVDPSTHVAYRSPDVLAVVQERTPFFAVHK
jgi:hypothetical protein